MYRGKRRPQRKSLFYELLSLLKMNPFSSRRNALPGAYADIITIEAHQHGQPSDIGIAEETLFNCGRYGLVGFVEVCEYGCVDGGTGKSEFCG